MMEEEETPLQPRHITRSGSMELPIPMISGQGTVWSNHLFAPEWFEDATEQSRWTGSQARRREIVFALAAAESYLFEWVLDEVLSLTPARFEEINKYFEPNQTQFVRPRFQAVTQRLRDDRKLAKCPNFSTGNPVWVEFVRLVDFRNGLVHGRASRPRVVGQDEKKEAFPSKTDLDQLSPGWAVGVVVDMAAELHDSAGTDPPGWLKRP